MGGSFRPKEFLQCREAAVQMLACLCVDHLKNKQEQFDKFIMNTLKVSSSLIINNCNKILEIRMMAIIIIIIIIK